MPGSPVKDSRICGLLFPTQNPMKPKFPVFSRKERSLYCFADSLPLCQALLDGGARIIQLRAKGLTASVFRELAEEMQAMARAHPVPATLIINDLADIALDIAADGLHLGQGDSDYRRVIKAAPPEMIVGVSVHTAAQALEAQDAGATYVGAGAVFSTVTKSDAKLIGLEELERIVAATRIPVVAIGGIGYENIDQVVKAGAHYFAIISDINQSSDMMSRMNELNRKISDTLSS
jgi:thiamine-phosphate pyrophosphorylase